MVQRRLCLLRLALMPGQLVQMQSLLLEAAYCVASSVASTARSSQYRFATVAEVRVRVVVLRFRREQAPVNRLRANQVVVANHSKTAWGFGTGTRI